MRMLVLDYLVRQNKAVSLTDLEHDFTQSDRITLYRTLKTFEEKGMVHGIDDGTGATKYALCEPDCAGGRHHDLHVHFYCQVCKETFCLPKHRLPEVSLPNRFQADEVSLLVKGVCDICNTIA